MRPIRRRLGTLVAAAQAFLAARPRLAKALAPALWVGGRVVRRLRLADFDYERWIALYDSLHERDRAAMAAYAESLHHRPLLSVVMPVCDPPEPFLRAAIDSVFAQAYGNWELCIADDASSAPHVREILESESNRDARVKVAYRAERGGISRASNDAAALATGEYLALLDHDDTLPPHALLLVADEIGRHPETVLVYSDEDKLDARGNRCEHYFKPDWNPALFRSQNYVCHLTVLRRDRFEEVGGFRPAYDGSQDWDLLLRATEGVPADGIRHIPHVLYHWRRHERSAAESTEAKPAAVEAGRRAVEDALTRTGTAGKVDTIEGMYQRVRYALPDPPPRVHAVIPSTAKPELLEPCLDGLLGRTDYDALAVTVAVSSAALGIPERAHLLERVGDDERARLFVYDEEPFSFAWVCNHAIAEIDAPLVLLVNDDVRVIRGDWLESMVGHVLQNRVAAVGAMLYYPDDTIQHAGVVVGLGGVAGHNHQRLPRGAPGYGARAWLDQDVSCVTAGCMLVRRDVFAAVGGFDERFAIAFNDVDLCLRIVDAGWRIVWTPSAELYHHESISIGRHDSSARAAAFAREMGMMTERWGERLLSDPYYNPNLSLRLPNRPAFPPRSGYPWRSR